MRRVVHEHELIEREPGDPPPRNRLRWQPITTDGHGVWFTYWEPADYYLFFAEQHGWPPTVTRDQPIGILDRLIDHVIQPALAAQAARGPQETATQKMTLIAGHKTA